MDTDGMFHVQIVKLHKKS